MFFVVIAITELTEFTRCDHTNVFHLFQDLIPPTEGPLEIFVDIFIFEVSKINDIELTMTFELYFDLSWTESRFQINESSPKWER